MLNTLAYVKRLRAAGVPEAQAEAHAEALAEAMAGEVATKADIAEVKGEIAELKGAIAELSGSVASLDARIAGVESRLEARIAALGHQLTVRMGSMIAGAVALLAALKFFD